VESVLELQNITKKFPGVLALHNVSFALRKGEIHAISGENGAGKSTLMKVVTGVYTPDAGEIRINGQPVAFRNPNDAFKQGISIIYQETSLFAEMTVLENLYLGHERIKKVLGFLPILDYSAMAEKYEGIFRQLNSGIDMHCKVKDLGMAQKQMVEIAKALTFDAKILIMDEPTASLTQREVSALFDIIRMLKKKGVSIVYISHRLEEIFEVCDRVTVLRDGQHISTDTVKDTNKSQLVTNMVGRALDNYYPKAQVEIGAVLLELKSISQNEVLRDINLTVRNGEIVGLAGLIGSGRTELAHLISGFTHPDGGSVFLDGEEKSITSYKKAMEEGIVYVSEDRAKYGLVIDMSIKHNISLPQLKKLSRMLFINREKESDVASQFMSDFAIKAPNAEFIVANLSGGNQQKVSVSKALALKPKLLILDEPTRGVDVNAKAEIHKIISMLSLKGLSILMISSELPELLGMCDRIYVMKDGEMKGCFLRSDATQENILTLALGVNGNVSQGVC